MNEINKVCKQCNETKPLTEFYSQNKTKKDGTPYIYHNPKCKDCVIEGSMKWNEDNRESYLRSIDKQNIKRRGAKRIHRENNLERYKKIQKSWRQNNPEKVKEHGTYRQMNKKHEISDKEWESCKKYFDYSCAYCGINETDAKETQGHYFHREHVDPNGANDLSNCIPSCRSCNSSKYYYELEEWYDEKNPNFKIERLNLINKWLEDDYKMYFQLKIQSK